jgi:1-acyl-sn-glycerol-3-phosphate acyltransferase
VRRALGSLFYLPAHRFGQVAANFENETTRAGLGAGAAQIMRDFSLTSTACGVENIPTEGPVLIVANHPGSYDSAVITASVPRRDLTLVVSDVPFVRSLAAASPHFIFVSTDMTERMDAIRQMVHRLQNGGAVLLFARGDVEPDPSFMSGAAATMAEWSHSIEILVRKVPQTQLVVEISSGVILPQFMNNPIVRLRRMPYHQQKLAEMLQLFQQLLFPKSIGETHVHISFSRPTLATDLPQTELMPAVIARARQALEEHVTWIKTLK